MTLHKATITGFTAANGHPVTKKISLNSDNVIVKTSLANNLCHAQALTFDVTADQFVSVLKGIDSNQALCYGMPKAQMEDHAYTIKTTREIITNPHQPGVIARNLDHFEYSSAPGIFVIDTDNASLSRSDFIETLTSIMPELGTVPIVSYPSTSSCIYTRDTSLELVGEKGYKTYIFVNNASLIPAFSNILYAHLEYAGYGYYVVAKNGNLLHRNLMDMAMYQPNRIDFCANAVCDSPLEQRRGIPLVFNAHSHYADLDKLLQKYAITLKMKAENKRKRHQQKLDLKPEEEAQKKYYFDSRVQDLLAKGMPEKQAIQQCREAVQKDVLPADFIITLDDGTQVTVADINANTDRFNARRCHDPLEPEYPDNRIGYIYIQKGKAFIHSHAHGGKKYFLQERSVFETVHNLPEGYELNPTGLYQVNQKTGANIRLCNPITVSSWSRDENGHNSGKKILFLTNQNETKAMHIRDVNLQDKSALLPMIDQGFSVSPNKALKVIECLNTYKGLQTTYNTKKTGWVNHADGAAYVTPTQTISRDEALLIEYLPESNPSNLHPIQQAGTLQEWQDNVAGVVKGSHFLTFAITLAFVSLIQFWVKCPFGGCHFFGRSSRGKTTLLQVAASVFGNGADPENHANGNPVYIQKWTASINGVEILANTFQDMLLCIDEIGSSSIKDFGPLVYLLTSGKGKTTMTQDRNLREPYYWSNLLISTGEVAMKVKIEEFGGVLKAGQAVRILDISCGDLIFEGLQSESPAKTAQQLKDACAQCYGHAGLCFVKNLLNLTANDDALRDHLDDLIVEAKKTLLQTTNVSLSAEQQRVVEKLAMPLVAGYLAVDFCILPMDRNDILQAVSFVRDHWLNDAADIADNSRAEANIRGFLLTHISRFITAAEFGITNIHNIAGIHGKNGEFLVYPQVFRNEMCKGFDIKSVCTDLAKKGLLIPSKSGEFTTRYSVKSGERVTVYVISRAILDDNKDAFIDMSDLTYQKDLFSQDPLWSCTANSDSSTAV